MRNLTVIVVLCVSLVETKASIIIGVPHEAKIRARDGGESSMTKVIVRTTFVSSVKNSVPSTLSSRFVGDQRTPRIAGRFRTGNNREGGDYERIDTARKHVPETNAAFPRYQSVNDALGTRGGWREQRSSSYSEVDNSITSALPRTEHSAVGDGTQSRGGSTNASSAMTDERLGGADAVALQSALPDGASAVAPKPDKLQVDAKEEKLRAALLTAEGPSKILREVERIPALRRLSDSALRVTSATASDGRLAALALYRLGAAARAAETAAARPLPPPATAAPATTVDASGAVESPASADQAREVHVQETEEAPPSSSPSFGYVSADTGDSSGATAAPAAPELTRLPSASGEGLEPEGGGMPVECANGEGEGGGGGRCNGVEGVIEETTAAAGKGRSDVGCPTSAMLPPSERADDTSASLRVGRGDGDGDDTHEADVVAHPSSAKTGEEDGGSEVGTVQYARDTVGREGEIHASSAAASTASSPLSPAPAAASAAAAASSTFVFDVEDLKHDLRFEQLVEIVECVASELSVSDISKVVWGLSILGHLPRNSFLESLAHLLTDRLRNECGYAALSPPADAPPSNPPPAGADVANAASAFKEEKDEVGAAGVGQTHPPSASTSPSGGAREQGDVVPPPGSGHPTSDGPTASVPAVLERNDAPDAAAADIARKDRDTPTVAPADGGGGTASASEAAGGSPALVTSGTDLATAALSFAYAHSRLDISTGELLEVIATCAIPQLVSMPLRDLANIAWAFAVQRHLHHELLAGIAHEVTSERTRRGGLDRMSVKDASVLAWSYGALGLRPAGLFATLAREGLSMVHEATAHDLSNLAWGLARAGLGAIDEDAEGETTDNSLEGDGEGIHGGSSSPSSSIDSNSNIGRDNTRREDRDDGAHSGDGTQAPDPASPPLPPDSSGEFKDLEGRGVSDEGGPWGLGWVLRKKAAAGRRRGVGRGNHGRGVAAIPRDAAEKSVVNEGFDALRETREAGCAVGGDGARDGDDGGDVAGVLAGVRHEGELDLLTSSQEDAAGVDVESPPLGQSLGEAVLIRASDCFGQFPPKHLSRLCWALGAWHDQGVVLPGAGLFTARALAEAGHHPKSYTAEELAQVLWSFATLVGNSDSPTQELAGLLGALAEGFESEQAEGVAGRSSGLDAATACDVLWSFAKLGHPAHSLCEAMARDLVDQVQQLPPSSVASLAWAYGKMRYPSAELMERVLSVVEKRLGDFTVKDAASALWALGALGYTVSLKRSFDFSPDDLRSLNPSASANLLWGLVKTGAAFADGFDREDLEAVAADVGPKLLSFSPTELCRTAWALGRLGVGGVYFGGARAVDVGASEDDGVVPEGGGGDDDGSEMSRLMDKLLGECSKWLELFTPQELETLLWAVCRLEHRADDLVAKMAAEAKQRQEGLPGLLQRSGPSAARDAAFHLGSFRHLLTKYAGIDFDGQKARGRYRRGKSLLSRMFRER